ncbi:MAG: DUF421 domain-containing protein [Alphaproteobacteria bacterium]
MFFDSWYDLARILVVGIFAYAGLIGLLRLTGKRTLARMNAFDFIVTVAFGSTLATVLLSSEVSLAEGLLALGLLCGLQFAVAWASVRWEGFQDLVKAQPSLLFYRGRMIDERLRLERVTRDEILAAVRAQGHAGLEAVEAVVLETDGSFSVVAGAGDDAAGSLRNVRGTPAQF